MKLFDFGERDTRSFFRQLIEWSQKRITLDDNVSCLSVTSNVATTETVIGHKLGRVPRYIVPAFSSETFDGGTLVNLNGLEMTQRPTDKAIYFKKTVQGNVTFLLFS